MLRGPSSSSTRPRAQASPEMRPEPSEPKTSTAPAASIRARRYSRRPARLRFSKPAGSSRPHGDCQGAPASRNSAGRAKISVQTKAATGLPGSAKTGRPCQLPSASGRPGLTAIRQAASAAAPPDQRRDVILVAGRGPAGGQDRVGLCGAAVQRRRHGLGTVRGVTEVERVHVPAPQDVEQHRPVGVVGLVRQRVGAGGADLVPGRKHRHPEPPAHGQAAEPDRRGQRQVLRGEPVAFGQDLGARRHVLARRAGVGARLRAALEADRGIAARHLLLEHHGVDARGQQRAGQDAQGAARRHRARIGRARRRPAGEQRQPVRRRPEAGMRKPVAVHGRIRRRRVGAPGVDRRRQHPAAGGGERQRFGVGDRRDSRSKPRQRHVDRQPVHPRRQRETVILLRRHRREPRSAAWWPAPRIQASSRATSARSPAVSSGAPEKSGAEAAGGVERGEGARGDPDLVGVEMLRPAIGGDLGGEKRRIDLGQHQRRVGNDEAGLERPDRDARQARIAAEALERRQPGEDLAADRAGAARAASRTWRPWRKAPPRRCATRAGILRTPVGCAADARGPAPGRCPRTARSRGGRR